MKVGTEKVQTGMEYANRAGNSLSSIMDSSQEVLVQISQIAALTEEQSVTTRKISQNMLSISQVTGESAKGIQELSNFADNLNGITKNLSELISRFSF